MTRQQLYSTADVAEILGVSASTLARWRRAGAPDLPYLRRGDRIYYRRSDVEEFIDDTTRDGGSTVDDEQLDEVLDEEDEPA